MEFYADPYRVIFYYYKEEPFKVGQKGQYWADIETLCIITLPGTDIRVEGSAFCSTSDQYNRQVGEEIALRRALQNLNETPGMKQYVREYYMYTVNQLKAQGEY